MESDVIQKPRRSSCELSAYERQYPVHLAKMEVPLEEFRGTFDVRVPVEKDQVQSVASAIRGVIYLGRQNLPSHSLQLIEARIIMSERPFRSTSAQILGRLMKHHSLSRQQPGAQIDVPTVSLLRARLPLGWYEESLQ